jgi:ubiquinone biosynthesis protein UbiJ
MRQHQPMEPKVEALIATLAQTSELLRRHGDSSIAARLQELETRLVRGDWTAVQSAVTEATGSMGSLRDRWLSVANGDAITHDQEQAVNAQLDALVKGVERTAREAAEAIGFQLFR